MNRIFNPATDSAEDFFGLTDAERIELREEGYRVEALRCVRFHDQYNDRPWFRRDHELVGYVFAVCDGGAPIDPDGVLKSAVKSFGPCDVLW